LAKGLRRPPPPRRRCGYRSSLSTDWHALAPSAPGESSPSPSRDLSRTSALACAVRCLGYPRPLDIPRQHCLHVAVLQRLFFECGEDILRLSRADLYLVAASSGAACHRARSRALSTAAAISQTSAQGPELEKEEAEVED